ncbi:MAG: hypothetical protein GZ089_00925 [Aromatoleum sp.]|nr:hypothetical protein [Aromatoleum sp.]
MTATIATALLTACAFDLVHVAQTPAPFHASEPTRRAFVLAQEVSLTLPFGYRRALKRGSLWSYVGTIDAGDVFASKDQVLTVEASNVHEAYIVVNGDNLVGFCLPVERTYSPATQRVSLPRNAP